MLTVWGRRTSSNVQKVLWALAELGLDYEHVPLGGRFGGLDTPEYGAMNPNRLVPTLRDGDLVIWESNAIVRYLSAEYGVGTLWPTAPKDRAVVDQWADWAATTLLPAFSRTFWAYVRTPQEQRDEARIAAAVEEAEKAYAIADAQLARTPFLAGPALTYADIIAGVSLYRWMEMGLGSRPLPNVGDWYERLKARDSYRETVCVSYEELVGRLAF